MRSNFKTKYKMNLNRFYKKHKGIGKYNYNKLCRKNLILRHFIKKNLTFNR